MCPSLISCNLGISLAEQNRIQPLLQSHINSEIFFLFFSPPDTTQFLLNRIQPLWVTVTNQFGILYFFFFFSQTPLKSRGFILKRSFKFFVLFPHRINFPGLFELLLFGCFSPWYLSPLLESLSTNQSRNKAWACDCVYKTT